MVSRLRTDVLAVCALTAATGIAVGAVAWTMSALGWLLVEIGTGEGNSVLPVLGLMLLGAVFVGLALVGAVVPRAEGAPVPRRPATAPRTRSGSFVGTVVPLGESVAVPRRLVTALVISALSFATSVIGAARITSRDVADVLTPVLDDPAQLNAPSGDGWLIVAIGLALAVVALVVVAVPTRDVGDRS